MSSSDYYRKDPPVPKDLSRYPSRIVYSTDHRLSDFEDEWILFPPTWLRRNLNELLLKSSTPVLLRTVWPLEVKALVNHACPHLSLWQNCLQLNIYPCIWFTKGGKAIQVARRGSVPKKTWDNTEWSVKVWPDWTSSRNNKPFSTDFCELFPKWTFGCLDLCWRFAKRMVNTS